jgi:hypothetical protein
MGFGRSAGATRRGKMAGLEHFQEKWNPVFRPKMRNARMLERLLFRSM